MVWVNSLVVAGMTVATIAVAMAKESDYDDSSRQVVVQTGKRIWIGKARSWNPECQSTGGSFEITQPPAHGTLSQDKIMSTIPPGGEDCAGRPAELPRLFYTAARGYQGQDHVTYDVSFGNGGRKHIDVDITVTGPFIKFHPGEVLHAVPARGTLNVPVGTAVLIDDGTCPSGEIKQLITGNVYKHIAGSFSCIQR